MTREIPAEDLPQEIRKDAPYIADGLLSEIDALEESAARAEAKGVGAKPSPEDDRPKAD